MPPTIAIDGLYKTYPGQKHPALHPLRAQVEAGEMVVVVGPNGAGKTTLFKLLATLVQPDGGQAWVSGHHLRQSLAVRRQIGLLSDPDRSFFWRLNARQNLEFFGSAYGLSGRVAAARISEMLDLLDLAEIAGQPLGQLSSGQRGRLALARALLHHPAVLLLDEPTRSLDPTAAAHFLDLLHRYLAETPTASILLSTHRLDAVAAACRRLWVLAEGHLRGDGAPTELLAQAGLSAGSSAQDDLARLYAHYTGPNAPADED
jgi:ABC-2 type transport system ATP-binding protein